MPTLDILIADDHQVVRMGLCSLLQQEPGWQVVGEAADGDVAVELARALKPAVVVVDLSLPLRSGLEVIRQIHRFAPQTQIVVLSIHADQAHVRAAFQAGAMAYVLKDAPGSELIQAVQAAVAGQRFLCSALPATFLEEHAPSSAPPLDLYDTLTPREHDVLIRSAQGQTAPEIATALHLSVRTVEGYRASMMRKLGLRNQTDIVVYALRRGIITLENP